MFGPLPPLHKWVLVLTAVLVCMGLGFWVGAVPEIPLASGRPCAYAATSRSRHPAGVGPEAGHVLAFRRE